MFSFLGMLGLKIVLWVAKLTVLDFALCLVGPFHYDCQLVFFCYVSVIFLLFLFVTVFNYCFLFVSSV